MKHSPLVSSHNPRHSATLAGDALDHLMMLLCEQCPPSQCEYLFHEVGKRLGRDAWRQYRTPFRLGRRPAVKDLVQCIAGLQELWEWPCTILHQTDDHVSVSAPTLPLENHIPAQTGQRTIVSLVASGVLAGMAEAAFGYGKVSLLPSDGLGRTHLRFVVYIQPTAQSESAPSVTYRNHARNLRGPHGRGPGEELAQLTRRERQVLQCVGHALSNKEIAGQLGISVRTVEGHVSRVCVKLDVRRRADLLRFALRHKLATL